MTMKTPLARVKGLGAAKEGVEHWWHQRLTALALAPLTVWFCLAIARLPGIDYATLVAWIAAPFNAVMLVVMIIASLYHGYLGVQVVMEDYVHPHWVRTTLIVASGFGAFLLAIAAIFVVLQLAFEN
jgi:succinate dehydrogenase / fumarate reductase membrane anchor subunit